MNPTISEIEKAQSHDLGNREDSKNPSMNRATHHKYFSVEWETPPEVFDPLNAEFGFEIDVAATPSNAKCPVFFTVEDDGLAIDWPDIGPLWMNPPYGRGLDKWMKKAVFESFQGCTVVALLPARTDTAWFHDFVLPYAELRFLRGRVRFIDQNGVRRSGNTTGSIVAVYRPREVSP